MILVRSPLRISLGGGGTDLPSYYTNHGGFFLAGAIDKYVYASINRPFSPGIYLKYSKVEQVSSINSIQHPIIRESLRYFSLNTPQIEITTLADIPAGTGLGSSGSFATALLKALHVHYRRSISSGDLAELACKVEIDQLLEPIGKQDQYISVVGGLTCFTVSNDGSVAHKSLNVSTQVIHDLEDNLLLFFTGSTRSAGSILVDQNNQTVKGSTRIIENLHSIKQIGLQSCEALISGNTSLFGELMNQHWHLKKDRSSIMTNELIDVAYKTAIKNGATGGKIVGAGGGGFLMFYAHDKEKLRHAMEKIGLPEIRFKFDFEGTKVILS